MLEQAQNRRLLVDSDSDEEPAKSHTKPVAETKPTDILQEVSEGRGFSTHRTSSPRPNPLSRAALPVLSLPCATLEPQCLSRMSSLESPCPCALG